jgi:hypothetical protein
VTAGRFLVEAHYEVRDGGAFHRALGIADEVARHHLEFAHARPDLIAVAPPGRFRRRVTPAGEVEPLGEGDPRPQLRVVDIKLSAESSPGYFAEVAYYTMALAGWLVDHRLDDRLVAVPDGAVWPGTHEAAALTRLCRRLEREGRTPTAPQLFEALEEDLEPVPFEVFAYRVRRFFRETVPDVLEASWRDLPWHVDNRCKGCDYLGYTWRNRQGQPTNHPDHCIPTAEASDHLCRVAFISRGAGAALRERGIGDVAALAGLPIESAVFEAHQTLRATRTVVAGRADVLRTLEARVPEKGVASAVMPRWADLRIYLSADFDRGSAITSAFGMRAFWREPRPFGHDDPAPRQTKTWRNLRPCLVVDRKDPAEERVQLLVLLRQVHAVLTEAKAAHPGTTFQVYLWDRLEYDHLVRVVGRHLQAILDDADLRHLAWLFPPEELLPNPALASRRSPLTIVREVVRAVPAAPIPHYYTLLTVARAYHDPATPEGVAKFSVHPLFEDPLSDQVPSERAHAIWGRTTEGWHWQGQLETLNETVKKRLSALEAVVKRLEADLRPLLGSTAPAIDVGPPGRQDRLSVDGQLWYAFAKLDAALSELEVHQVRAMPPHEREARFKSAWLRRRLAGEGERQALEVLGLAPAAGRRAYRLREPSREVNLREGDFNYAVSPELTSNFLDSNFARLARDAGLGPLPDWINPRTRMEQVTKVTVRGLDRERGLIALDASPRWPTILDDLEAAGIADFSRNVVLDPVYTDFFTRKLLAALRAVGNPPTAVDRGHVRRATGQAGGRGARRTRPTPAADLLWDAAGMHAAAVPKALAPIRGRLVERGPDLNPTQWVAWEQALSRRLQLIWGPPGTGKSRTARAVVLGALLEAHAAGRPPASSCAPRPTRRWTSCCWGPPRPCPGSCPRGPAGPAGCDPLTTSRTGRSPTGWTPSWARPTRPSTCAAGWCGARGWRWSGARPNRSTSCSSWATRTRRAVCST